MNELPRVIPDVQMLLALTPEELGAKIIFLLRQRKEEQFHLGNLQRELWQFNGVNNGQPQYPRQHEKEITGIVWP